MRQTCSHWSRRRSSSAWRRMAGRSCSWRVRVRASRPMADLTRAAAGSGAGTSLHALPPRPAFRASFRRSELRSKGLGPAIKWSTTSLTGVFSTILPFTSRSTLARPTSSGASQTPRIFQIHSGGRFTQPGPKPSSDLRDIARAFDGSGHTQRLGMESRGACPGRYAPPGQTPCPHLSHGSPAARAELDGFRRPLRVGLLESKAYPRCMARAGCVGRARPGAVLGSDVPGGPVISLVADKRHPLSRLSRSSVCSSGIPTSLSNAACPSCPPCIPESYHFESWVVEPTAALEQNCPARGSLADLVLAMAGEARRARARTAARRRMGNLRHRESSLEPGSPRLVASCLKKSSTVLFRYGLL